MDTQTHPLFGILAVKNGFASEAEIDLALDAQKEDPGGAPRLGEILIEMGTITPEKVQAVLTEQGCIEKYESFPPNAPKLEGTLARLVQQAGPAIVLNDAPLTEQRTIVAGQRFRIGDAVLQLEGTALLLVPACKAGASPAATAAEEPAVAFKEIPAIEAAPNESSTQLPKVASPAAETPKPEAPAGPNKIVKILHAIDAGFAKVLPSVHNHRKYLTLLVAPGIFTLFLPWRLGKDTRMVFGIQGPGWPTFLLFLAVAAFVWFGVLKKPLFRQEKTGILVASGLALLLMLWKLFAPPDWAMAIGVGLPLALVSAGAVHAAAWLCRPEQGAPDQTLISKAVLLLQNLTGKRAKEKKAAVEKRDDLLRLIGEAALKAKIACPDADAVAKAQTMLETAQKREAGAAESKDATAAKASVKAAQARLSRAVQKLGRHAIDKGLTPDGEQAKADELKTLDEKLKQLG